MKVIPNNGKYGDFLEEKPQNDLEQELEDDSVELEEDDSEEKDDSVELEDSVEEFIDDQSIEAESNMQLEDNISDIPVQDEKSLKMQLREFHRNLIEASLYAAGRPLTIEELSTRLEFPKKEVEELVNELAFDYLERPTALIIAQIGDRFQMQIRPEYTEQVSKFAKGGAIAERYLRTLTIIALKQPILKSMVVKIRGTGAYEHVKYLIDNGFINAVKKGRSHELTTTDKYADMFGLPKDKTELKRAMVTQLGIEEVSSSEPLYGSEVPDDYQPSDESESPEHLVENEISDDYEPSDETETAYENKEVEE